MPVTLDPAETPDLGGEELDRTDSASKVQAPTTEKGAVVMHAGTLQRFVLVLSE
jgi:hypothetical protein